MKKFLLMVMMTTMVSLANGCSKAEAEQLPNSVNVSPDPATTFMSSINEAKKPCLCKGEDLMTNTLGVISVESFRSTDPLDNRETEVFRVSCRAYVKKSLDGGVVTTLNLCENFQAL